MLPDRYRPFFRPATLATASAQRSRIEIRNPLFFRGALTANVVENERRSYQPAVILDDKGARSARCTCSPGMKADDLCRHLAVLVADTIDPDGTPASERFESSLWRAIGFAAFAEGRAIEVGSGDPREQMLRTMVLTDAERRLLERGAGSQRLQWEVSGWYRWAKSKFLVDRDARESRVDVRDGVMFVDDLAVPGDAAERVIASGAPEQSGFQIAPESLEPSFEISITEQGALRFVPVLLTREEADAPALIHRRSTLPRFGRFFLIGRRFASIAPHAPLFADERDAGQVSLFERRPADGMPIERETVIPSANVFAFIARHRAELAAMHAELAPECIRNAVAVRLDAEVVFDVRRGSGRKLEIDLRFSVGRSVGHVCDVPTHDFSVGHVCDVPTHDFSVGHVCDVPTRDHPENMEGTSQTRPTEVLHGREIVEARRNGVHAILRGNHWIDVSDPQFNCLDHLKIVDERLELSPLDLVRARGTLRGKHHFEGDESAAGLFEVHDEIRATGDVPAPSELGLDLYAYQQSGYQWLSLLHRNGFGGLLCDDMGLGKTHQAMALIAAIGRTDPGASILVVCPTSVLDHWRDKLSRFLPGGKVTLTSYGIVRSRVEQIRERRWDLLVLDEAQTIKNSDTATHQALQSLSRGVAIGLTGTPIENHEGELKTLLDFVVPGYLPENIADRRLLQRLVKPFVLRRTKQQVLTELPPKIVDKRRCEMTSEQRAIYQSVLQSRVRPLREQLRSSRNVSYVHVFAALNYLKQVCNHPLSAGGGFAQNVPSAKFELLAELLDECIGSGLKVVVFSQYLKMLEIIEAHLKERAIGFASIKGATVDRGREVRRFRDDPDCRVFTASLRAAGLGIDLTAASVVIHYDRWWNQAREDQATDRVHRLGQSKGVQVLKLITRGSVEEKIDELIDRKGRLANDVVREDDPTLVKQFTIDELDELLAG